MKQGIIFDLDGTLWDSAEGVTKAWNRVLEKNSLELRLDVPMMHSLMGKQMDEIAEILFPGFEKEKQLSLMEDCCIEEHNVLAAEGGILYPKLRETLKALSEEYFLAIVSNCQKGYIETFLEAHGLGDCFKDTECFGNTGRPKGANIAAVVKRNKLERAFYLGDTQGDCDAAAAAGIPFIHAAYGFGKVKNAAYSISSFSQLRELLKSLE